MKVVGAAAVPVTVAVPLDAAGDTLQINALSAVSSSVEQSEVPSVARRERHTCIGNGNGPAPCVITGASFTAVTVTFTVIVSFKSPSETCTTKLSLPL